MSKQSIGSHLFAILMGTSLMYYFAVREQDRHLRIRDKVFAEKATVYTVIDSAHTTDWSSPILDTIISIPLKASVRFNEEAAYLIKKESVPVRNTPSFRK